MVALGADGPPCNNNLDAWVEMRHAALLAKRFGDPTALPAREVLRMATIDGAHCEPGGGPEARLVYAAQASDVRHTVVDGQVLMQFRALRTLDEAAVLGRARAEARKVAGRAGLAVAP